ncbi:hypothetical protein FSY75_27510 [Streptomyces sp. TR1341]|uniref:Uncharacterized protein n=1 Tax=Streptomyces murinus TaxID=33900 RepID=A0A7W3NRP8_STRMR|nr:MULTISPECIES: DUF6716 putative glycosyltransferase [Streptomyces]NDK28137.1 hypothetical protein [Streptomyces sp. TR1341]MBA9055550.1 hypothetical protein [Streptomyces murinus]UWW90125.1 hypothetical protein GO605_04100 [Streptomyces murinus]WSI87348.1 hypothetical protein OG516_23800 [Streptomyces murinus]WUD08987.1 hypothetical protein OG586_23510 [Streptomyces murinus]
MPASATKSLRVAVLADSDTRWKWGALTARRLTPAAAEVRLDGYLLRGRATPTARQLQEVGVRADSLSEVTGVEFLHAMSQEPYDILVLALVGGGVQAMLHGLRGAWGTGPRPVVVTGYVGVVYEKLADGLLLRHGADLVLANSRHDADRFRAVYEGVGADASSVTEVALPFLGGAPYSGEHEPYTVVFAAQPSVPDNRRDRTYLLDRLIRHARTHPEREVLLKLRSKPGEHTTHIEELPYQKLVQGKDVPDNFRLVYGHMGEVLDRTDLLVTVSSTAALEALHRRVPTVVLTDLGVREALGNHHFTGSGCLASWDQLDAGHRPAPDEEWVARQGVATDGSYETAFDAARERIATLLDRAGGLPPLTPYYTPETAPGYLPGILARHHLGPDGAPLPGAPTADKAPGPVRQIVRRAARGAYRHGVQRVAPVIRRMGEL